MKKVNINLRWTILIAAILLPASFSELKLGFGQENKPAQNGESNEFVEYLEITWNAALDEMSLLTPCRKTMLGTDTK